MNEKWNSGLLDLWKNDKKTQVAKIPRWLGSPALREKSLGIHAPNRGKKELSVG